jgi:hypothetical protein
VELDRARGASPVLGVLSVVAWLAIAVLLWRILDGRTDAEPTRLAAGAALLGGSVLGGGLAAMLHLRPQRIGARSSTAVGVAYALIGGVLLLQGHESAVVIAALATGSAVVSARDAATLVE